MNLALDINHLGVRAGLKALLRKSFYRQFSIEIKKYGKITIRSTDSDFDTIRQIFVREEYDIKSAEVKATLAKRYDEILAGGNSPIIIDAGANIGAAAIWFARQWPSAKIVCIEPDSENFRALEENISRHQNIQGIKAAIGANSGFVQVENSEKSWAVQTKRADTGLPIVSIKNIMAASNSALFLVKVDIEGFESDLFSDDLDWLDEVSAVYIEPHDWMLPGAKSSRNFQTAFGVRDFDLHICGENILYVK